MTVTAMRKRLVGNSRCYELTIDFESMAQAWIFAVENLCTRIPAGRKPFRAFPSRSLKAGPNAISASAFFRYLLIFLRVTLSYFELLRVFVPGIPCFPVVSGFEFSGVSRPFGTRKLRILFPALKRRAILGSPSGTALRWLVEFIFFGF